MSDNHKLSDINPSTGNQQQSLYRPLTYTRYKDEPPHSTPPSEGILLHTPSAHITIPDDESLNKAMQMLGEYDMVIGNSPIASPSLLFSPGNITSGHNETLFPTETGVRQPLHEYHSEVKSPNYSHLFESSGSSSLIASSPFSMADNSTELQQPHQSTIQQQFNQARHEIASNRIEIIRHHISTKFCQASQIVVALHEFYQNWEKPNQEAAYAAGLLVNASAAEVMSWVREFEANNFQLPSSRSEHDSITSVRPLKRGWLLEDYPRILNRARQWVRAMAEKSLKAEGRLFRITEFQKWVNEDLLAPLYGTSDLRVSPISHSTARSWLARLGYYDELKQMEAQYQATHSKDDNSHSEPESEEFTSFDETIQKQIVETVSFGSNTRARANSLKQNSLRLEESRPRVKEVKPGSSSSTDGSKRKRAKTWTSNDLQENIQPASDTAQSQDHISKSVQQRPPKKHDFASLDIAFP